MPSSTTPLSFEVPAKRNPAYALDFQKLESLAYIFVVVCTSLSSFEFVLWAPKDASFLHQSAFWPFKVVQGHPLSMILVPVESAYDFLLVINSNVGPILHRFWDTATYWLKIAYFSYPSIRRPRSPCSLWNFAAKLTVRKLQSWGWPPVKTHDRSWSRFGMIPACDRRSVRQTDGQTVGQNLS